MELDLGLRGIWVAELFLLNYQERQKHSTYGSKKKVSVV